MRHVLKVTERQVDRHANGFRHFADVDLSVSEVAALEARNRKNPEDLDALKTLLISYWTHLSPSAPRNEMLTARRRARIVWSIEHHPDADLAGSPEARLFPDEFGSLSDPIGHARARQLWLAHTKRSDASAAVLGNAASFFDAEDRPLAEALLLRARAKDPQGPSSARLGLFYLEPQGAYANERHQKLVEDPKVMAYGELVLITSKFGRRFAWIIVPKRGSGLGRDVFIFQDRGVEARCSPGNRELPQWKLAVYR
jgi:hypothetical protein